MSIANELNRLLQAKSDLATSISNKGVTVPAAATLDDYAALVDQIQTGGLPYDAEVEYLQGDGSAYINTGIPASTNLMVAAVVDLTNFPASGSSFIFSSRVAYGSQAFGVVFNGTSFSSYPSKFRFDLNSSNTVSSNVTLGKHTVIFDAQNKKGIIDGATSYNLPTGTFSNSVDIVLFGLNNNGSVTPHQGMRIVSYSLFRNGELIQSFIPVRVRQVGYMYDRVSDKLFGNANSTGAFIVGPDVT